MVLAAMRLQGALNGLRRRPGRALVGLALLGLVYWGMHEITVRALRFLDSYPDIGSIADAVARRSLEGLLAVLMVAVAFSVLTGAIGTLYGSVDLPFLLSQPVAAYRVFALKVAETYASSALLPAVFTVPVLVALGGERSAPAVYYPIALLALASLYALPVALGALLALMLMRVAPAGKAREFATAASVVVAAGLVFGLRALRPEQLQAMTPDEFEALLQGFAALEIGWLPSAWAADAVWQGLAGRFSAGATLLVALALVALAGLALLATRAYATGWYRSEGDTPWGGGRKRSAERVPLWERVLGPLGGGILVKDLKLLLRDPSQWSQLLVLGALAGVYFISTASLSVDIQRFRDVIGAINVAFLGFLLAGVGVRLAFPLVSLEGEALWLLRTAPVRAWRVVFAKFLGALPPMLALGVGLGIAVAGRLELSPALAFAAPLAGGLAAFATAGLGVGLGAAFPRFDSVNPHEVAVSSGGLLYMALSLAYAALSTVLFAYPSWRALVGGRSAFSWTAPDGLLVLGALVLLCALFTVVPLLAGSRRLSRWEPSE